MGLKFLPAEGSQRVASINCNDRKQEVEQIRLADGFPELGAAELVQMETPRK